MKINIAKYLTVACIFGISLTSCEDFLDRPTEDSYTTEQYYQSDQECYNGVNYLYNLPWSYLLDSWFSALEMAAGNHIKGQDPFVLLSIPRNNAWLGNMVASQWAAIGNANLVYKNISNGNASEAAKNATMGECLVWKGLAYFNLVRMLGPIPIVHDNSADIGNNSYADKRCVTTADAYEYTIMTLERAMQLLPKEAAAGRLDYYSAEALLAKVYLAKSGLNRTGDRNPADLEMAANLAKDVIDNSGRELYEVYSDNFRGKNNFSKESLISWHFYGTEHPWGAGNQLPAVFGMKGFSESLTWGDWDAPSVDLMEAFGVSPLDNPEHRTEVDVRRKASMMMAGDKYDYFWRDKGGFDYLRFIYDNEYNKSSDGSLHSGTGANMVKHLYGNTNDHIAEMGYMETSAQASGLSIHVLRLSDIYLIYSEAVIGNNASTTDESAIDAFFKVRNRAVKTYKRPTSVSFEDVWKERRLELAFEADRWFDYVRMSYYNPDRAINELKNMKRSEFYGLDELYKGYYEGNGWNITSSVQYNPNPIIINPDASVFRFPMPDADVTFNPNLLLEPIHVDVRSEYSY